jgi:heparan-alpha-glucosaminide N-acetyltransferase
MEKKLTDQRVLSIDAFRGLTILVMIFVNELAGIRDIPQWMKHMPAKADDMSFVDIVFPAFLFIVGMSVPFALNNRFAKKDSFLRVQQHILWRSLALIVLGVFMVNAESAGSNSSMSISIYVWSLLFFLASILVWKVYSGLNRQLVLGLRCVGLIGLVILAIIYRGGEDGQELFRTRWFGILGLIGWSYLFPCLFYQIFRGRIILLIALLAGCSLLYYLTREPGWRDLHGMRFWDFIGKNATHLALCISGVVVSLLFFDQSKPIAVRNRFLLVAGFALILFAAGFFLRPSFQISKIFATPTWGFYSAGICSLLFSLLYYIIDIRHYSGWTAFFKPAGANPLLTYIIPDIIYNITMLFHVSLFPNSLRYGVPGILWSMFFAVAVLFIVRGLNRIHFRLQL